MSKGIKYGLISLLVLVVVGIGVLTITIDGIVESGITEIGSEMTGTPVTVDNVSISLFSGRGTVSGLRVANPEGYEEEYALVVDDFTIEVDVMSLFSDEVVVYEIIISSPVIYVEQQLPDNNIQTILNNINNTGSFEASDSEMLIEHFLLQDGTADLYTEVGGERSAHVEMSTIELNNIGSGDGRQAVEDVIRQIAEQVAEEASQAALESGGEQLQDAIRDLFN